MKLLIIAGPYEADRIRRASLQAGFETVAVEPGESLSGWITASRPELIVMAPQIVHSDPALALAKVRAVPRGRVPIFLVGDEADEARMRDLADGFFLRPVAPELLLERARAILSPARGKAEASGPRRGGVVPERTEMGIGPTAPIPSPAPAPGSGGINAANEFARGGRTPKSGPHGSGGRSGATLKPLVASAAGGGGGGGRSGRPDMSALMAELDTGIDALFDAELVAAVAQGPQTQKSGPFTSSAAAPLRPPAKVAAAKPAVRLPAKSEAKAEPEAKAKSEPEAKAKPEPEVLAGATPEPEGKPEAQAVSLAGAQADFAGEPTKKMQPSFLGAALQVSAGDRARARLLERYAPVEEGDYFAVLGVGRDADAADLRRAHQRISGEIAPDAIEPELARELAAQIDAIRVVSAEALRVLGDERLRPRYLSHVPK